MKQRQDGKTLLTITIAVVLVAFGVLGGWLWAMQAMRPMSMSDQAAKASQDQPQKEPKVLYWYDPMYPQQHFDAPGKSPFMEMELVPRYTDEGDGEGGEMSGIKIRPEATQNIGMRLAEVTCIPLATQLEVTGIIGFNEHAVAIAQTRSGGFVERVWPLAVGDLVTAGQPLVELFLPEWTAAQYDLLAVRSVGDKNLLAAARARMRLLGMPDETIRAVERSGTVQTRFQIKAPITGVLQVVEARTGMTLMAGQTVARINGLDSVWLEAAVPEIMAGGVTTGNEAKVQLVSSPEKIIEGRVAAILPALNETARTLRVRIELPNKDGRLQPGLSAKVTLHSATGEIALAVPTEAIIRTGKRALVMLANEGGSYTPVEVSLGREIGDQTVITAGLSEGQAIVASGQFLIDSEASLRGFVARAATAAPETEELTEELLQELHEADAVIKSINDKEVTLEHGPFESLSMPGMTMTFALAFPDLAQDLKVGDKVRVAVKQTDAGLVVEKLEKTGDKP